jgi:hypothetical protein
MRVSTLKTYKCGGYLSNATLATLKQRFLTKIGTIEKTQIIVLINTIFKVERLMYDGWCEGDASFFYVAPGRISCLAYRIVTLSSSTKIIGALLSQVRPTQ